ncbi:Panacea domain-containing protein [Virgibacillus oceani]|uniref:Antitoxin SocA-like Panacea domain-containing protein n=1 Tax=Virgibacillus oceani TaxID=1479511 RepID=A0A917H1U4_9BACI|nr:Panacea domain-containing protein [Virgibacillus oceani]GGG64872.1 hypothetical protein GCM10011398_05630 [Virgibacillus oceani]
MTRSAFDFAQKYIRDGLDNPRNTKKGNMKLQKLLYFSQLVHHAEYGVPLFKDKIYAYENGCVVESVMKQYHLRHDELVSASHLASQTFSLEEKFTIDLVESVFGELSAGELSDLNHEHSCWKLAYGRSYIDENYRNKHLSEISDQEVYEHDLEGIKKIVDGYKSSNDSLTEAMITIGGTEFYFNPQEIIIDEQLRSYLDNFVGEDEVFTIYKDRSQGVIVY